MAIFRVAKTRDYTVMSNYHLRDKNLTLKAKGLLSLILSLPEDWNYTTRGLAAICKEGVGSIGAALRELESAGYLSRHRLRDKSGRISDTEYVVYESPRKETEANSPDKVSQGHGWAGYGFTMYGKPVYGFPGYGNTANGCAGYGKPCAIKYSGIQYV
mgnify:FL=1